MNLHEKFLNKENFYLAFKRLKAFYTQNIEWYDSIELFSFEANLATNIYYLIKRVQESDFQPNPITALPFPKVGKGEENNIRPFYKICIEDQIIWLATINVIGHFFEKKIPNWSYGNRLYKPMWYSEDENGKATINHGSLNNSSSHIYRKWNQSWPFFRRHISITIKAMASGGKLTEDDFENDLEKEIFINEKEKPFKEYPYLDSKYWKTKPTDKLYWLSLDFEKFFPSINTGNVFQNIRHSLVIDEKRTDVNLILSVIEKLLAFDVNSNGWDYDTFDQFKDNFIDAKTGKCKGLPTGLLVSGFLANVALLGLDSKINNWVDTNRNLAFFKFVDDQVIISDSNETIDKFLDFYNKELCQLTTGVTFKSDKIEPSIFSYDAISGFEKINNELSNELNVEYPEPFLSDVLRKMSNLNEEEFSLMDEEELGRNEEDLRYFLLAKFDDTGIRKDTRLSFSVMRLCRLVKYIVPDFSMFDPNLDSNKLLITTEIAELLKGKSKAKQKIIKKEFRELQLKGLQNEEITRVYLIYDRIFNLILKSTIEFPDKLKLWKRCIDFCYITGVAKISEIYEKLEAVNIHSESKIYIRAYCNLVFSDYLLQAEARLTNDIISFWDKHRLRNFKLNILEYQSTIQSNHQFYNSSVELLSTTQSFCLTHLVSLTNQGLDTSSAESYLYLFLKKIYKNRKIWEANILNVDVNSPISWAIFSFHPNELPLSVFDKIISQNKAYLEMKVDLPFLHTGKIISERTNFINQHEGFLLEIFSKNLDIRKKYQDLFPQIKKVLAAKHRNYLTLDKWLEKILKLNTNAKSIDPRLSEWSIIEIVIQISKEIEKKYIELGNKFLFEKNLYKMFFVHPNNYLIPKKWTSNIDFTWDSWRKITKEYPLKLNDIELFVDDNRYLPFKNYWGSSGGLTTFFGSGFTTIIVGLCTLMIKILSNSLEWPPSSNKTEFLDSFYSSTLSTIENQPISTQTKHFLNAIFSRRNDDFLFKPNIFYWEGNQINNMSGFISALEKLQINLTQFQISLIENEPRQLIYIDIDLQNEIQSI